MECLSGNSSGITKFWLNWFDLGSILVYAATFSQIVYARKQYGVIAYDDVDAKIFSRKEIFNGSDWAGFLWLSRRAFNW